MTRTAAAIVLAIATVTVGCSRSQGREYPLTGQILAVDPARQEVTIRHEDIQGFMPGMTMPFHVRDAKLVEGRVPGDLVRATLVVGDGAPFLRTLERTGHAPVPPDAALPRSSALLPPGAAVADASLVDETGAPRRLADWRGHVVAVTFMYTRCPLPDFCPLMDRRFKAVQDAIAGDLELKARARLVSISIDPEFDTPPVLARHAASLGADPSVWRFLTGAPAAVDAFAAQFGIAVMREDPREIVHNLRTAVIDAHGALATVLNGSEWTTDDLLAELRKADAAR
jgi:protein SCO1/2